MSIKITDIRHDQASQEYTVSGPILVQTKYGSHPSEYLKPGLSFSKTQIRPNGPRFATLIVILSVPKFTAILFCICFSVTQIYTSADAVQIYGKVWDTQQNEFLLSAVHVFIFFISHKPSVPSCCPCLEYQVYIFVVCICNIAALKKGLRILKCFVLKHLWYLPWYLYNLVVQNMLRT